MRYIVFIASACLIWCLSFEADAACWRLPNGSIVETNNNSTPPMRNAQRVPCPAPELQEPPGEYVITQRQDGRECVDYARSRVGRLPTGLFTMQDKRNIINGSRPRRGSIAIINQSSAGHVAYIEEVTRNSITVSETNFPRGTYRVRRVVGTTLADAERRLRIVGYFDP